MTIDMEYGHCTDYIRRYTSGSLELSPGCDSAETLESKISETLNNIREATANVRFLFSSTSLFLFIVQSWFSASDRCIKYCHSC